MTTINNSGIRPIENRVLILIEETEKVSKGGIIIPETTKDRRDAASSVATIVAMGSSAFHEEHVLEEDKPFIGSKVVIKSYTGIRHTGLDELEYRLIEDSDIIAILEE